MDRIEITKLIGKNIREQRDSNKMTRAQLCDKVGLSLPQMLKVERGVHLPSVIVLKKVANVFNIYIEDLMQ